MITLIARLEVSQTFGFPYIYTKVVLTFNYSGDDRTITLHEIDGGLGHSICILSAVRESKARPCLRQGKQVSGGPFLSTGDPPLSKSSKLKKHCFLTVTIDISFPVLYNCRILKE